MNQSLHKIKEPSPMGSYSPDDVVFLLKDIGNWVEEQSNEVRERAIQSGVHYSEMLPIEYQPSAPYVELFHASLEESAEKMAIAVGIVASQIIRRHGENVVLASLARAGTPVGVLIKQYIKKRYDLNLPHYSLSIIRGKGIDENAIHYMQQRHPQAPIQFIDGWTGKGAITGVLQKACDDFERKFGKPLNSELAVLADPGYCAHLYGTREDFLIPSACLNSTVSGLVSRTVLRTDLIASDDFHGARYYRDLANEDLSYTFIRAITECFDRSRVVMEIDKASNLICEKPTWKGMEDVELLRKTFSIEDVNHIKPGIGETTRVLLRRVPWKILVKDIKNPNLKHILLLAEERGVPVEIFPNMTYNCCGIIKSLGGDL